jgi:hypothetical protein
MTKAYLVKLSGVKDAEWKILDQEAWNHLEACCNWQHGHPVPVPSEALIADMIAWGVEEGEDGLSEEEARAEAIELLTMNPRSNSADNDVALSMPGSAFNGERFNDYEPTVKALNAFVAKHGLDLEEVYDGYIY